MNVLVVADGHYYITPDGEVYADSVYDYAFYARYLQSFDHVYAVIRAKEMEYPPKGKKKSSGEGITFFRLSNYQGPYQYVLKYCEIKKQVKKICNKEDIQCGIFRIPSATGNIFAKTFLATKKPFAVEVVTDPWENFGSRTAGNILMLFIVRRTWTSLVKRMCLGANGASYVTEKYLQEKYPPRTRLVPNDKEAFESFYSSVEIADNSYSEYRLWDSKQKQFTISHVSNYFSGYEKGHLVLMKAVEKVLKSGYDVKLVFIGDGPYMEVFKKHAKDLNIEDNVIFLGRLANGSEVKHVIHNSDLFILPTYAEGLPRVLLEAMSEGIPCLSSPVCGIPEILDHKFLYDFDDVDGFAKGIIDFISNPEMLIEESKRNIEVSKEFSSSVLNKKRKNFYDKLAAISK